MPSVRLVWSGLLIWVLGVSAYLNHGDATLPKIDQYISTIPHHLSRPEYAKVTGAAPSLISAIAPLVTTMPDGGRQTLYSMYYNRGAVEAQQRVGIGFFKRGVFADDPPFPTCSPCGDFGGSGGLTSSFSGGTAFSTEPECKTIPYFGVFRTRDPRSSSYCFQSSYSGVFSTTQPYSYTLPCCVTTPESCLVNRTTLTTSSYSFTSGVFVSSTTYTSNATVSTYTAPSSSSFTLSSRFSLSSASRSSGSGLESASSSRPNVSGSSSASSSRSSVSGSSSGGNGGISPGLGSTTGPGLSYSGSQTGTSSSSSSSSGRSSLSTTSGSSQSGASTSSFSVVVISSTTITLSAQTASTSSSNSVITVITITTTSSFSGPTTTTPAPTIFATVVGCGTVNSGSGTVNGSGTVFPAGFPFIPVTSSGIVSGYAPLVIGCGVLLGTGTFSGTAEITGCGEGNGTATLTGAGTVWPDIGGRPQTTLSFTSTGTISGQGRVKGCGILTGSGTFTVSEQPIPTRTPSSTRSLVVVETYISYCGPSSSVAVNGGAFNFNRIAANGTSPASSSPNNDTNHDHSGVFNASAAGVKPADEPESLFHNDTLPVNPWLFNSSSSSTTNGTNNTSTPELDNPNCKSCPESGGICCPRDTPCDAQGKCPWAGIVAAGYIRHGYNMVMARNMSDGTQIGDGGVRPEEVGFGGVMGQEKEVLEGLLGGGAGGALGGAWGAGVMGGTGEQGQRIGAPHPMGGSVGSVLAKRERDERRKSEEEREDMLRRGLLEEGRHDFVIGGDDA